MKKILIGSTAIKHWFPDFPREPKDIDYATDAEQKSGEENVEYLYNPVLFKYCQQDICPADLLLTLKMSHLFWEYKWDRHMFDVQFLLKQGCKYDLNILLELKEFWEEYLPKVRRSNLATTKEDFFTNAVNDDVDQHDFLHTLLNPVPMYTRILKDGAEVELDELKWERLSFEDKCNVVYEETIVMAQERYKNPTNKLINDKIGYVNQLKANIQKHFPIFIAIFAIENYPLLEQLPTKYDLTKIKEYINNKTKVYAD